MTYFAGEAGPEDSPVLHAAIGLAEQIRAASDEIETGRRIPQPIAAAMRVGLRALNQVSKTLYS